MRYNTTVKYNGNEITIKVPFKSLEGTFELPDFLKKIREIADMSVKEVHLILDWGSDEIADFEEGKRDIPQKYLSAFARNFNLPQKLKYLGIIEEKERKKKLIARLKQLRMENDVPQILLAADLEIARSTYACYESGKNDPDIYTLWKLADLYQISLDDLVGREFKDENKQ